MNFALFVREHAVGNVNDPTIVHPSLIDARFRNDVRLSPLCSILPVQTDGPDINQIWYAYVGIF